MAETICGYCQVLALLFKYLDCSVFYDPEIAALLKNFTLETPLWSLEVP